LWVYLTKESGVGHGCSRPWAPVCVAPLQHLHV